MPVPHSILTESSSFLNLKHMLTAQPATDNCTSAIVQPIDNMAQ
jgi:hypothetical protein